MAVLTVYLGPEDRDVWMDEPLAQVGDIGVVITIDSEWMAVRSGTGSRHLVVDRGDAATEKTPHEIGTTVSTPALSSGITPDPADIVLVAPEGKASYVFGGIGATDSSGGAAEIIGGDGNGTGIGGEVVLAGGNAGTGGGTGAYIVAFGGEGSAVHGALQVWTAGTTGPGVLVSDGTSVTYSLANFVANGSTVDQLRDALIAAGLMAPAP